MDAWDRQWGRTAGSKLPVEKAIIGLIVVVSAGIFLYSRVQRDAALARSAAAVHEGRKPFDGRITPGQPARTDAQVSMMVLPPTHTGSQAPEPAAAAGAAPAAAASAPAPAANAAPLAGAGPGEPGADARVPARLNPQAAHAGDPAAGLSAGTAATARAQPLPGDPQSVVAKAIAAAARGLPGTASARNGRGGLRGLGGAAAARGPVGGASASAGPELAAATGGTGGPLGSALPGAAPAPAGAPPASHKDARPGDNPDHVANTTPGTGPSGGGTTLSKQNFADRREDLRLRAVCLRVNCGVPAVGIAQAALQRRRDGARKAVQLLTSAAAKLRQPPGLGAELTAASGGLAAPLDADSKSQASPRTELDDAAKRLDKDAACLGKFGKKDKDKDKSAIAIHKPAKKEDPWHDTAAIDACHADALSALDELNDAAIRIDTQRQSGTATLRAMYEGAHARAGGDFRSRMEAEAVQRLNGSYDQGLAQASAEAKGTARPVPAAQAARTRTAAAGMSQGADGGQTTLKATRSWTGNLPASKSREAALVSLDDGTAALTDAQKLWKAQAASDAAATDAVGLTQASRDVVDALSDMGTASASLQKIQDTTPGSLGTLQPPTSGSCRPLDLE